MQTANIHVFAKWRVKEGHLNTVMTLLAKAVQESRKEEGNLFYQPHQSSADAHTIILFEGYTDQAAAEIHRNSSHFQEIVVGQIVPLLETREVIVTQPLQLQEGN